jgi:signal transduction histidine kinase
MLVQNALEAMPKGGHIFLRAKQSRTGQVIVQVADNGSGMTKKTREQCLEPFFTTKPKGTGLGLAVVDRIVRRHRGVFRIVSSEKKGTICSMRFVANSQSQQTGMSSPLRCD